MTRSIPISVQISTAASSRPPFANAWTSTICGRGGSSWTTSRTMRESEDLSAPLTSQRRRRPAPSTTSTHSPAPMRRTEAAWRPSEPDRATRSPTDRDEGAGVRSSPRKTGSVMAAQPMKVSRSLSKKVGC